MCFVDEGRRYTKRYEEYIYHRVQVTTVEQVKREEEGSSGFEVIIKTN
ncbi:transposase family protein [Microcoleus sp. S28C3]